VHQVNLYSFGFDLSFEPPYLFLFGTGVLAWLSAALGGYVVARSLEKHLTPQILFPE
jgi:hypothetical protein